MAHISLRTKSLCEVFKYLFDCFTENKINFKLADLIKKCFNSGKYNPSFDELRKILIVARIVCSEYKAYEKFVEYVDYCANSNNESSNYAATEQERYQWNYQTTLAILGMFASKEYKITYSECIEDFAHVCEFYEKNQSIYMADFSSYSPNEVVLILNDYTYEGQRNCTKITTMFKSDYQNIDLSKIYQLMNTRLMLQPLTVTFILGILKKIAETNIEYRGLYHYLDSLHFEFAIIRSEFLWKELSRV